MKKRASLSSGFAVAQYSVYTIDLTLFKYRMHLSNYLGSSLIKVQTLIKTKYYILKRSNIENITLIFFLELIEALDTRHLIL